jgi:DNA-binding XRE family transcriptional regulator
MAKKKKLDKDPRSAKQKTADEELVRAIESGVVDPERRKAARARLRERADARRAAAREVARLGSELKHVRTEAGLTQAELAEAIGTKNTDVSRMEAGKHPVTIERLLAIIEVLETKTGAKLIRSFRDEAPYVATFGVGQECWETVACDED